MGVPWGLAVKLVLAWRLAPHLPAVIAKMGQCISAALETESLRARVAQLEAQLGHAAGGGATAAADGEALFFPDPAMPCRAGRACRRGAACGYAHETTSLMRLLAHLGAARANIDVAVFSITCDELADALLAAHARGVRVRIVSDNDQAETKGSDIARLRAAGVPTRVDRSPAHMHHKFAVVDGRVLVTGSFNWTRAGVLDNEENVLVLRHPALAAAYGRRFEQLWAKYG